MCGENLNYVKVTPKKRCDLCLVRMAVKRVKKHDVLRELENERMKLMGKIARLEDRGKEIDKRFDVKLKAIIHSIKRVIEKDYAEVCRICSRDPVAKTVMAVENKVFPEVLDEVCMDCPMQYQGMCRFGLNPFDEKEAKRRQRLYVKYGRVILCR